VDKVRAGIVADPAAAQGQGSIAEARSPDPRQTYVDGHGLHMETVQGYAAAVCAQELIAPGRAVAANHVDFGVRMAGCDGQVVQQIEETGVVVVDIAGAVVRAGWQISAGRIFPIIVFTSRSSMGQQAIFQRGSRMASPLGRRWASSPSCNKAGDKGLNAEDYDGSPWAGRVKLAAEFGNSFLQRHWCTPLAGRV
jgi:hypothetical protein